MEIMSITKFNKIQTEKMNSDIKKGILLDIKKYIVITTNNTIRQNGFICFDHTGIFTWFKTKNETINYLNDILKNI
jgi:hypothetical protein